ncbi:hypothetical protein HFP72_01155 [Nocardiopsis sp. ARC36]
MADYSWGHEPVFQALLFSRVDTPPVSATPDLQMPLTIGSRWWRDLRTMLHRLRQVPAPQGRRSHTPGFVERIPTTCPRSLRPGWT